MKTEGLSILLTDAAYKPPRRYPTNMHHPPLKQVDGRGVREIGFSKGFLYIRFAQNTLYRWKTDNRDLYYELLSSTSPTRMFNSQIKHSYPSERFDEKEDEWKKLPGR